jgi:ATP-binding cassette subfamily F protein 3
METVLNNKWIEVSEEITVATSDLGPDEAERRVRALRSPVRTLPRLHLQLRSQQRSGDLVIRTRDLQVGFPDKPLFGTPDIELRRRECAALIGPNGAGKTTFLKTILGQLQPLAGEVILGASLNIGYFAQAHEGLEAGRTVMEEIEALMPGWLPGQVRDYLGRYLFSGDDVFKKVGMLSGGERGRLALARLALGDTNLLLLDEPTNHLDIPSQEILQAVLDDYAGTILLVTHDRYLVDALATQIWEVDPDESALTVFKGSYSQLKAERDAEAARQAAMEGEESTKRGGRPSRSPEARAERRRIARLQELENQVAALEDRLAELGKQLENPPTDPAEVSKLGKEYATVQHEMDEKLEEWEALQAEAQPADR